MSRYIACIEIRPLPSGTWIYEDHRAVFEGEVEITFYHPNPLIRFRPRRFRIPITYTMHVPPFYTYHGPPPARPARSYHSFRFRPTRSHPFTSRVVHKETPPSDPRSPVRVSRSPDPVPSGRVHSSSDEIEEDPVEDESGSEPVVHSTGSDWRDEDP
ncbi:hypothetical protein RIF29_09151 [Crotalaria pallida]|uniref:Uncharacterized protein n=1 Tax=Crotalaria pallida TaxID=3830 RepID=A0AAN9FUE8_CROPI